MAVVVVGVSMSGCAPGGLSTAAPSGSPAPNRFGAPVVTSPRDVRGRVDDPCTLLTEDQLEKIGLPVSSARTVPLTPGVACVWKAENERTLSLSALDRSDLLVDTYRARFLPVFVPTTVASLPAVYQQAERDDISCTMTTGVADGQALDATWTELGRVSGRSKADPCERARAATEAAVSNLPPLAR